MLLNPCGSPGRRVLLLYTGGTIGMMPKADGSLGPEPGALAPRMMKLEELESSRMPLCYYKEFDPVIDSADMCPDDWNTIARAVHDAYYDYDGFVIIHGTDTLAYTASALSFMLEQLAKPVVLTGSQLPLFEPLSDARQNLLSAIAFAGFADVCEVCIYFHDRLLRGNRASKVDSDSLAAFKSPRYPNLADMGVEINLFRNQLRRPPTGRFRMHSITVTDIMVVWVIPGFSDSFLEPMVGASKSPVRGMVLLLYGCGNAPAKKITFLNHIRKLTDQGVIIAACSQCQVGSVALDKYAVGKAFADAGVLSAADMTVEATVTKMAYLLSKDLSSLDTRRAMLQDLRGEMTTNQDTFAVGAPVTGIASAL